VLDRQLQDTVFQFEHVPGVVQRIDKDSAQLAAALQGETAKIVITTMQKFPFILDKVAGLKGKRFAVIVDEAHSSQSGESAAALKKVLLKLGSDDIDADGDLLTASALARGRHASLSYFAFTATPKPKTLELFGTPHPVTGNPHPFHTYSMRQAIDEGFILDVLRNYVTYQAYWKLANANPYDPEVDPKKAGAQLARFVSLHPTANAQRAEIIVEHFRKHTPGGRGRQRRGQLRRGLRPAVRGYCDLAARRQRQVDAAVPRRQDASDSAQAVRATPGVRDDPPAERHRLAPRSTIRSKPTVAPVDPPALYVAHDERMAIVSILPLKIQGGGAETYRWGSILEISPAPPGEGVDVRSTFRFAAYILLALSVLLICAQVRWWPVILMIGFVTLVIAVAYPAQRKAGVILAPEMHRRRDDHKILIDDDDRAAMSEAIDIGERISQTWPLLQGLVDTTAAERLLAHALWELAGVLERRQGLREMRDDLAGQHHDDLPADSRAARDLLAQREKVAAALAGLDAEVDRHVADLTAAAIAGENFIREREIGQLVRETDERLAMLAPHDLPGEQKSGAELADQTQAVLTAYRDLTTRYGDGI
jgi:hypothetical protein